ncbi:hypothetical protein Tco_0757692 [Tanacetum coccineum]
MGRVIESTTIGQDAPSTSHSPSSSKVQPPISHQGITAGPTIKDNPFAQAKDNPFVNVFAPEPSSEESSSGDLNMAYPLPLDTAYLVLCPIQRIHTTVADVSKHEDVIWDVIFLILHLLDGWDQVFNYKKLDHFTMKALWILLDQREMMRLEDNDEGIFDNEDGN